MNKVICKICGKEFKSLAGHLKKHGHDKNSYHEIFPNAIIQSLDEEQKKKISISHWSKKDPDNVIEILHKIQDNSKGNKSWFFSQKMQQSFFCASGWEKTKMQKYDIDENIMSFTNRHCIKISYHYQGKDRCYIPDLLLEMKDGTRIIEEIKGHARDLEQVNAKSIAARRFAEQNGMEYRITYEP